MAITEFMFWIVDALKIREIKGYEGVKRAVQGACEAYG